MSSLPTGFFLVWRSGNGIDHINKVNPRRAWLVLRLVTLSGPTSSLPSIRPDRTCPLSLAILPWAGAMSTSDGWFRLLLEKRKRVLRSSGLQGLAYRLKSDKGAGC